MNVNLLLFTLTLTTATADLKNTAKGMNSFGWPLSRDENLAEIREIQEEVPNKLLTTIPAEGTFIVLLSESTAAVDADPRRGRKLTAGLSFSEKAAANKRAMEGIARELNTVSQQSGERFCGEVVSQHANLNMMVVTTSPNCTRWLAKRSDVEALEVDGQLQAYQEEPPIRRLRGAANR